jgi:cyclophilin family peptidyl-prolyl cis-trans isomerase
MPIRLLRGLALALLLLLPVSAYAQTGAPAGDQPPREKYKPAHLPTNDELVSKTKAPPPVVPTEAEWRTPDPDDLLVIDTNKGRIVVEMYPEVAPAHVAQIRTLAKRHFYDGLTFFRVIDEFMDQTGDPKNSGEGGSDLPNLKAEFLFRRGPDTPFIKASTLHGMDVGFVGALPVSSQTDALMALTADGKVNAWVVYCPGVAAMARAGDPDSANSQFFLMRGFYPTLMQKYTAWGKVLTGQDVVTAIKTGEPVADPQDRITTLRLASDMPPADRPKVQVLDTRGPAFRSILTRTMAEKGPAGSVCDVQVPTR